ncbi:hypothetical protein RFI_16760, partial [Reticulomyxa filosa]
CCAYHHLQQESGGISPICLGFWEVSIYIFLCFVSGYILTNNKFFLKKNKGVSASWYTLTRTQTYVTYNFLHLEESPLAKEMRYQIWKRNPTHPFLSEFEEDVSLFEENKKSLPGKHVINKDDKKVEGKERDVPHTPHRRRSVDSSDDIDNERYGHNRSQKRQQSALSRDIKFSFFHYSRHISQILNHNIMIMITIIITSDDDMQDSSQLENKSRRERRRRKRELEDNIDESDDISFNESYASRRRKSLDSSNRQKKSDHSFYNDSDDDQKWS